MIYIGLNLRKILYKEPGNIFEDCSELISGKPCRNQYTLLFEYYENFIYINKSRLDDTLLYAILQKDIKEHFRKMV